MLAEIKHSPLNPRPPSNRPVFQELIHGQNLHYH